MPAYKCGDIVLVRFHPAYGQELKKYRPAVIASAIPNQLDARFALIVPFTSRLKAGNKFEFPITNPVLRQPSLLLCWYLKTIDAQRITSRLGCLSTQDNNQFIRLLKQLF
jgi:mRNA-degrading endonuclease toxin of MazEF toxin-antitoxin module